VSEVERSEPVPGAGSRLAHERLRAARLRRGGETPGAFEEAHRKGAEGERLVGQALNLAAQSVGGVVVLHDLVRGRGRGNIDHAVVGSGGVRIVDAKAWSGRVSLSPSGLYRGRHSCRRHFDGLARQKSRIHSVLAHAGRDDVPVETLLCLVNGADGLDGELRWHDGHGIGTIDPVARYAIGGGPLAPDVVASVVALLKENFSARGGVVGAGSPQPHVASTTITRPPSPSRGVHRRRGSASAVSASKGFVVAVLLCVLLGIAVQLVRTGIASVTEGIRTPPPMSRGELRSQMPLLRELAREQAAGTVRKARVTRTARSFVVTFRRGARCRVRIAVPRTGPDRSLPGVTSAGCRR
jgi:hypothetical protein